MFADVLQMYLFIYIIIYSVIFKSVLAELNCRVPNLGKPKSQAF